MTNKPENLTFPLTVSQPAIIVRKIH